MSETTVASTGAVTATCALPLLAAAGVVVGAVWAVSKLASVLSEAVLDLERPIGADTLAGQYVAAARAARDRMLAELPAQPESAIARRAAEAVIRARAIREAFRETPALALVAEARRRPEIERAIRRLDEAQAACARGAYAAALGRAREVEATLADVARVAAHQLGAAQQQIVAYKVRVALPALGYRVQEATVGGRSAFRATSQERVLGVVVAEGGKLLVEAAGFECTACRPAIAALFRRLRDEGIAVEPLVSRPHGRWEGGPLLEQAGPGPADLLRTAERLQAKGRPVAGGAKPQGGRTRTAEDRQKVAAWLWGQQQAMGR